MKTLTSFRLGLVVVAIAVCSVQSALAQSRKHTDEENKSLVVFSDDYDDDSVKTKPQSYDQKGPGCLFGLEIGANISNYYFSNIPGRTYNNQFTVAGRFGGILDIALSKHFFLEPGLFAVVNGTNLTYNNYIPEHAYVYSGELPINIQYKTGNYRGDRFFVGVGGFVGYNFTGTISNTTATIYPGDIKVGTNPNDFVAPIDYGVGANVGYQMKNGMFFRARYQMGLANLSPNTNDGSTIHSMSIGAQVGFFFRGACK